MILCRRFGSSRSRASGFQVPGLSGSPYVSQVGPLDTVPSFSFFGVRVTTPLYRLLLRPFGIDGIHFCCVHTVGPAHPVPVPIYAGQNLTYCVCKDARRIGSLCEDVLVGLGIPPSWCRCDYGPRRGVAWSGDVRRWRVLHSERLPC